MSRAYDWWFFLLPPVLSLGVGWALARSSLRSANVDFFGQRMGLEAFAVSALVQAHLVAVFLRSHGNREVFARHRARFVLVPLVLVATLWVSSLAMVCAQVLATFWDVYHSGAQTFGLARIYDRNEGNDPREGRRLDFALNQLLYAGPIFAGATLFDHVRVFEGFSSVGLDRLARVSVFAVQTQPRWASIVVLGGGFFLLAYVLAYLQLHRRGRRVSWLKVWLVVSTGLCSVLSWGLNRWGEALLVMNLFHAVQYLALVWALEGRAQCDRAVQRGWRGSRVHGLLLYLLVLAGYGVAAARVDASRSLPGAVVLTVALMHFWYDGFVWSVSREHV